MPANLTVISRRWVDAAACRTADPALFHAPDADMPEAEADRWARENAALAVCETCPVRVACLAHAEAVRDAWAVRGGTTPAMRGWRVNGQPIGPGPYHRTVRTAA